jgi:two-component system, chemotaxis family, chemotaxis protein CheY
MAYLVADDSKLARLSLIKSLRIYDENAEIFQAENGESAVEIAKKEAIDIVFLDLTMPIMDGYTALPLMIENNENIKVIVVSADIQTQAKAKVYELGAKLHVQKPISIEKMEEILEKIHG